MTIKLNIGAGNSPIKGYENLDRKTGQEACPLKYDTGSVDEVRASHILEHFGFREAPEVLAEWMRVLKPGGRIRIAVPDVDKVLAASATDIKWPLYLMGGQTDENDFHKSVWNEGNLRKVMEAAGIENIEPWSSDNTDCASLPISLNLEGMKGHTPMAASTRPDSQTLKIVAVMSLPRYGCNTAWGAIIDGLRPFGIPIRRYTGVFWGQCMQTVMEGCLADGIDWILTLDYDTLFTAQQLDELLGIFGDNPQIDAMAALQCRRGSPFPLMCIKGETARDVDGQPIKVHTAHFGCTLLRSEHLADLPKPWFKGVPGPGGVWTDDDKMDPDIYFWHNWRLNGHNIFVTPRVRVGHVEEMNTYFDEHLDQQHEYVSEWWKRKEQRAEKEPQNAHPVH
ncbi:MAG: methyltransferase domain-containing protein [Phycisphaerae bacterium]|nr:methyltransferase domain-containing protein [Phycisphaerae bacterium]